MSENIKYLNQIYQNTRELIYFIENIENKITTIEFKKVIKEQLADYEGIANLVIDLFVKYGKTEKDISPLTKVNDFVESNIKTFGDNKNQEIAKLLITKTSKSIANLQNISLKDSLCTEEILKLKDRLLNIEEKNLEKIKDLL